MSIEVVTSWQTLMAYAHALGNARLSGDAERIATAQREHDAYRDACLASDRMLLDSTVGELRETR